MSYHTPNYTYQTRSLSYVYNVPDRLNSSFSAPESPIKSSVTYVNTNTSQKDENLYQFDWATHLQIVFENQKSDTASKIIVNNLNNIDAVLVYANYQFQIDDLTKQLSKTHTGIIKQVNDYSQIKQIFEQKNNIVKVFVLIKDYFKPLSQSHCVPEFVNLAINLNGKDIINIDQYKKKFRKSKNQYHNGKISGAVANLFPYQSDAEKLHSLLLTNNLKSQILQFQHMQLLSHYCKMVQTQTKQYGYTNNSPIIRNTVTNETRNDVRTQESPNRTIKVQSNWNGIVTTPIVSTPHLSSNSIHSSQQKRESMHGIGIQERPVIHDMPGFHDSSNAYGWATFLQAKISDHQRSAQCGKFINANKNKFHSCVVYTFYESKGNQILNFLDEDIRKCTSLIQISSQKPLNKEYFSALQKGSLRVLIICTGRQFNLNDWKLPYNTDFIINEELSKSDTINESRIQRQYNDRVEYRGVVLNFAMYVNQTQAITGLSNIAKAKVENVSSNNYKLEHLFSENRLNTFQQSPLKQQYRPLIGKQQQQNQHKLPMVNNLSVTNKQQQKPKPTQTAATLYPSYTASTTQYNNLSYPNYTGNSHTVPEVHSSHNYQPKIQIRNTKTVQEKQTVNASDRNTTTNNNVTAQISQSRKSYQSERKKEEKLMNLSSDNIGKLPKIKTQQTMQDSFNSFIQANNYEKFRKDQQKSMMEFLQQKLMSKLTQKLTQNANIIIQEVNKCNQNNHNTMFSIVSKEIPDKIQQCTQAILKTKTDLQTMMSSNDITNNRVPVNSNIDNRELYQKYRQINLKRDEFQRQQENKMKALNSKLTMKQLPVAQNQLQFTLNQLLIQNEKNMQQIKQLQLSKAQSVKIHKQEVQLKQELRKQIAKIQQLTQERDKLIQWKRQYEANYDTVVSNYTILQKQYETLKNKCNDEEQTKNQLGAEFAALKKDIVDAKEEIIQIIGLRMQQMPPKSPSLTIASSKLLSTQNTIISANQNKIKDIYHSTMTETIRKYFHAEKKESKSNKEQNNNKDNKDNKDHQKLKPILQKAINKTLKKQDTQLLSELQEYKQLKAYLSEACRKLQSNNILVYFNNIIVKLIGYCDESKYYQTDFIKYCQQMENIFALLAQKVPVTFKTGANCSVSSILDNNRRQSVVNNHIKIICQNVNDYTGFCYDKIEELRKANNQINDLKKAYDIHQDVIKKLQASKKQAEGRQNGSYFIQPQQMQPSSQINRQKQVLQNVRKQLAQKIQQFSTNQNNYLKTISQLNQQLERNKWSLDSLRKQLQNEKRNSVNAANQANKQLERVRKNATEGMNRLRDEIAKLQKNSKYGMAVEVKSQKRDNQLMKHFTQQKERAIAEVTNSLKLQHQYQLSQKMAALASKHQSQLSQTTKSLTQKHQSELSQTIASLTSKHNTEIATLTSKHNTEIATLIQNHNAALTKLKSQAQPTHSRLYQPVQSNSHHQQQKIKKFLNILNTTLFRITKIQVSLNLDNYQRVLGMFQSKFSEKYGKILFMPQSFMYKIMKQEDKKYIYDNIVRVTNKKISHTETLFTYHNSPGDTWEEWRGKILDKPNILVLMTLANDWQIAGFSENPYSQTDKWQTGKGWLMSITNKRCYDVKKLYEGKVARYAPYTLVFGNNELIITSNMTFSIIMNKMNLHFATQGDRSISFIGMPQTQQGDFKEVEIHQIIFE